MKKLLLLLLCLPFIGFGQSWDQLGNDMDGEATDDLAGNHVSLSNDGSTVAVGSSSNDGIGTAAGHVRVYRWDGVFWQQLGQDIDGETPYSRSGRVALSHDGNILAIGAISNSPNGVVQAGHVRVYNWNGSSWVQLGEDIDGEAENDWSGFSVSISSDGYTVAIGAPDNDGNGADAGHVRIYNWTGASWIQLGEDIDGETSYNLSGSSISLSNDGNTVAIGEHGNASGLNEGGQVKIYNWDGFTWNQIGRDINGETGSSSGFSVSLAGSENIVAIGAPWYDAAKGYIRIYSFNGSSWVQLGNDIIGEATYDYSGKAVAINDNGTIVAVGAPYANGSDTASGDVRVYNWDGSIWKQIGDDINGENANDQCGSAVSISGEGNVLAIGAPLNNGNGNYSGHTRVFINNSTSSNIKDYNQFLKDKILKVTDLLGRETKGTNQPLLYLYDDGTVEKRIVIE